MNVRAIPKSARLLGIKNCDIMRKSSSRIEKIDGELPNRHQEVVEREKQKADVATDEKLSKLRAIDAEIQAKQY